MVRIGGISILVLIILSMISCNNSKKMGYFGKQVSDEVRLERKGVDDNLYLVTNLPGKWKVYTGDVPDNIDFSHPLLEGNKPGEYILDSNNSVRNYFQFVSSEGGALLGEGHLPLKGAYNFRDFGGIRNKEGKYIKWGKIFRSDDLHTLTDEDMIYLNSIPLMSVIDFRSPAEINSSPDRLPPTVKNKYELSISPGNLAGISPGALAGFTVAQGDSIMKAINYEFVTSPEAIDQYRKFFDILQDESALPLVFHCTAGKDRTGMAAWLFLSSLGVNEATLKENYLLSNTYLQPKYGEYATKYPFLKPLLSVDNSYIQTGINEIVKKHGSVENFLKEVLGVDFNKMRNIYL